MTAQKQRGGRGLTSLGNARAAKHTSTGHTRSTGIKTLIKLKFYLPKGSQNTPREYTLEKDLRGIITMTECKQENLKWRQRPGNKRSGLFSSKNHSPRDDSYRLELLRKSFKLTLKHNAILVTFSIIFCFHITSFSFLKSSQFLYSKDFRHH